jgi:hypothetical protein
MKKNKLDKPNKPSLIYSLNEEQRRRWEEQIPLELREIPRWVPWCLEFDPKRDNWTKVPHDPGTWERASVTDPTTWGTFNEALDVCFGGAGRYDGIGVVLTADDDTVAIDLDDCRTPDTGQIAAWAKDIVNRFCSYFEISPSGTGIRIFLRGKLPAEGRRKGGIEVYEDGRFVTVTGFALDGCDIKDCSDELAKWHAEVFPPTPTTAPQAATCAASTLSDERVLRLAFGAKNGDETRSLYNGDATSFSDDHSEADLALLGRLAFYTQDESQLDRLFRSSKLYRKKWDERRGSLTYGQRTVRKALRGCTDSYKPRRSKADQSDSALRAEESQMLGAEQDVQTDTADVSTPDSNVAGSPRKAAIPAAHPFRLIRKFSDLDNLPPQEYLIDEILPCGGFSCIAGAYGHGKTFVALDMVGSIACGIPYHSRAVKQGRILFVEAEGVGGLRGRKQAWLAGRPEADPNMLEEYADLVLKAVQLCEPDQLDELLQEIKRLPEMPVLVIIDTLARANQGRDENSARDMSVFVQACDRIRQETGAAVMILHHTGKSGDIRGSTAFPGALDTIMLSTMNNSKTTITLQCTKQKDDREFGALHFTLEPDENSGSVYLEPTEHSTGNTDLLNAKERTVCDAIEEQGSQWLALKDVLRLLPDIPESTLQKIIRNLVKKERLETNGGGRNTRYRVPANRRFGFN